MNDVSLQHTNILCTFIFHDNCNRTLAARHKNVMHQIDSVVVTMSLCDLKPDCANAALT